MDVLKYSSLRLGVFAVVFLGCLQLRLGEFTLLFAMLIGLVVSWAVGYLFFNTWRLAAGEQLARWLARRRYSTAEVDDNAAEDAIAEQFHEDQAPPHEDKER